eukprot:3736365-Rhodomonas_salina.2
MRPDERRRWRADHLLGGEAAGSDAAVVEEGENSCRCCVVTAWCRPGVACCRGTRTHVTGAGVETVWRAGSWPVSINALGVMQAVTGLIWLEK